MKLNLDTIAHTDTVDNGKKTKEIYLEWTG